jgi:hypothetical protein
MASSARPAHTPSKPVDEARLILLAADALITIMAELRLRIVHTRNPLASARVLLAEAHVLEAVSILRSIPSEPIAESEMASPARAPAAA